jgi:ATP adenylyltransferase
MAYIGGAKEPGCIFCLNPQAGDPRQGLVLARTGAACVMLNRFPYANGHLMVAPRRHTADVNALSAPGYGALMETLRRSMGVLERVFRPQGMNVGMNVGRAAGAGIAEHLHWHIVPRWVGDTNYMPLIGEVRVIPEHLESVYDRLRPEFAALESDLGGGE